MDYSYSSSSIQLAPSSVMLTIKSKAKCGGNEQVSGRDLLGRMKAEC